jgi:hypothetical protein
MRAHPGKDTRSLQAYLGHKNIQHTVRYTELDLLHQFGHVDREAPEQLTNPRRRGVPFKWCWWWNWQRSVKLD